jgi:hypothetical protein
MFPRVHKVFTKFMIAPYSLSMSKLFRFSLSIDRKEWYPGHTDRTWSSAFCLSDGGLEERELFQESYDIGVFGTAEAARFIASLCRFEV